MSASAENQGQNMQSTTLPATLDIAGAEALLTLVKEKLPDGNIQLDASGVERLTTPCIQILLSADKTLKDQGGTLVITSPSEAFKQALADLGFDDQCKQWSKA